jgi:hypothetical protein
MLRFQPVHQISDVSMQVFRIHLHRDFIYTTGSFLIQIAPATFQEVCVQFPVEIPKPVVFTSLRPIGYSP